MTASREPRVVESDDPGLALADRLREALDLGDGESAFPWQQELLKRFAAGKLERSIDIPTGLGKTAVMAIWLIARASGAKLPRRLVYVVDRRAVVDQASEVARGLRAFVDRHPDIKRDLQLGDRPLPISTLRGQFVDNREWLVDPASPAIIVGTVDMVGSRLLFEGYGVSRKMRPYHAGLLGADTLLVLDEAHLVPPFEKLLEGIAKGAVPFGPRDEASREVVPAFHVLSLSATGRASSGPPYGLTEEDFIHPVVSRRLSAPKRVSLLRLEAANETPLPDVLAQQAWNLTDRGTRPCRIIVFCDSRKDAGATRTAIESLAREDAETGLPPVEVELFVGGRRVFERERAARRLRDLGFLAGSKVETTRPVFVIATSAGEVGVDLDADHMVCDLVHWERMVQRLGRVNRRGDGDAVIVVVTPEPQPTKAVKEALKKPPEDRDEKEDRTVAKFESDLKQARVLIRPIEKLFNVEDGSKEGDGSPGAIRKLKLKASEDSELRAVLDAATSPAPLRPALSRAVIDAWSMTSLKEHTGRPAIAPWLRGWIDDDPPQTSVVWRTHLPTRRRGMVSKKEVEAFFEAAPPHASEALETDTWSVVEWITKRAKALRKKTTDGDSDDIASDLRDEDILAIALSAAGDLRDRLSLNSLDVSGDDKKALIQTLSGATLVADSRLAGLNDGLLDSSQIHAPRTVDDGKEWLPSVNGEPVVRFRVRHVTADEESSLPSGRREWRPRFSFVTSASEDGEATTILVVEKWKGDSSTEDDRAVGQPQLLGSHQELAEKLAREMARRLEMSPEHELALAVAARLHDEGKRSKRWQKAFNALTDGTYAKTPGPVNVHLLDGYRHEFGSLPVAAVDPEVVALPPDVQDLVLHLIAAHHGFARPVISVTGCEDAPPSVLDERARDVALRFARMQRQWGPWGLAWWESLLRAVDHHASRENESRTATSTEIQSNV